MMLKFRLFLTILFILVIQQVFAYVQSMEMDISRSSCYANESHFEANDFGWTLEAEVSLFHICFGGGLNEDNCFERNKKTKDARLSCFNSTTKFLSKFAIIEYLSAIKPHITSVPIYLELEKLIL